MEAILISSTGEVDKLTINSPADVFGADHFTIIGACIELGYVYIGYIDAISKSLTPNTHIPHELRVQSVFDDKVVHGPMLIVQTDSYGNPMDIVFEI